MTRELPAGLAELCYPGAEYYHSVTSRVDKAGRETGVLPWAVARPFYDRMIQKIFSALTCFPDVATKNTQRTTTHDTYTKDAFLKFTTVSSMDVLLVDEAQDCSAAQLSWLAGQCRPGRLIMFIGDSVQSVYGKLHYFAMRISVLCDFKYTASLTCWCFHLLAFRGADPFFLANLESLVTVPVRDLHLTKSFRFGKNIGAIANLILFAKSHSPQVECFSPYRLLAGAIDPGVVSSKSLEELGLKSGTIVCRYNASLVEVGLGLLESFKNAKIAILGPPNNESSGKAKLKKVCKEIELFYNVFMETSSRIEGIGFEGLVNLEWGDIVNMVNEEVRVPNCLI